mmetsp:Transcript_10104/g.15114  ORF Transcript_10104/g.15114 Transcript_10104/m.15114 type:complete len:457 (-) Transcript_10104:223-1593(-)
MKRSRQENNAKFSPHVYLECNSGGSSKFYEIVTENCEVTLRYGKIGSDGVTSVKRFKTNDETQSFVRSTMNEKIKKGYSDRSSVRDSESHEQTILKNYDDIIPDVVQQQSKIKDENAFYLECSEDDLTKFYNMTWKENVVSCKYGIKGTSGNSAEKQFGTAMDARKYVDKVLADKLRNGYYEASSSTNSSVFISNSKTSTAITSKTIESKIVKDDPEEQLEDLENGLKVYIQGSSSLPYTCKKFDGGYSCTCQGWTMNVKNKGVQATSCKHLRSIRGDEAEYLRCEENSGVFNPSSKSQRSNGIVAKIALAHPWKQTTDPTGYLMSEKLDGMRAYWTGKQLFTRSGLAIVHPEWFTAAFPKDLELDGELFLGRKKFEECMSITRRTDKGGDWTRVSYVVFDAPTVAGGIQTRLETAAEAIQTGICDLQPLYPQSLLHSLIGLDFHALIRACHAVVI